MRMVYSFNDASMIYMTNDMTAMLEDARQARAEHVEKGINEYGRVFQNIGQGAIPSSMPMPLAIHRNMNTMNT